MLPAGQPVRAYSERSSTAAQDSPTPLRPKSRTDRYLHEMPQFCSKANNNTTLYRLATQETYIPFLDRKMRKSVSDNIAERLAARRPGKLWLCSREDRFWQSLSARLPAH